MSIGLGLVLVAAAEAAAQRQLTIAVGPAEYDLSGTGWSATAHTYLETAINSWLRSEYGTGFFFYSPQSGGTVAFLIPEIGVAAQGPASLPLYLGVGAGYSLTIGGNQPNDPSLYGAVGLDLPARNLRVRPEMRIRVIDFVGVIAGFTLGIALPID